MLLRRSGSAVLAYAPAKVNLFLEVTRRRADGYHELNTLMLKVDLYDTLTITEDPAGDLTLTCDHPALSTGPDNLVLRAAEALRQRAGLVRGARIHLKKRIPMLAGMAGGSTDCAATLAGLNELWDANLSREELMTLGGELGSDVPFFFCPTPAAWCTGRGERIEPLSPGCRLHLVTVAPGVGLSTAEVFRNLTVPAEPVAGARMCRAVEAGDVMEVGRFLHNRLQEPAEKLLPRLCGLRERLLTLAPAGALMTGSGSCVYALCVDAADSLRIARALDSTREEWPGLRVSIVRSCD